jgi:murein DD-endopeptidase MepM/ murein hydrolase activator NlpD
MMGFVPAHRFLFLIGLILIGTGCSSLPSPMDSNRKGFFDRLSGMPSGQSVSKHSSAPVLGRRASRVDVPHVENPFDFHWPLKSVEVTSPYGKRGRDFHEGIDLRAKPGTPVFAAQAGVVLYADSRIGGYGRMIVVKHDGKVATIYAHNSKVMVKRGDKVKQGQLIAMSGNTGRSRGPHLHFEVRRGVAAVNPLTLLPRVPRHKDTRPALVATSR